MASVVSFNVQVSVTATDGNGNKVQLTSGSPSVDFARFNGLQTLIDMNDVAAGTYNCVSITLGSGTLGYLDTSTPPPTITTEAATLSSSTLTYPLTNPMIVAQAGAPVGLHMDFNLRKSIVVDSNGHITGTVNPTFNVKAVNNSDPGAYIDEFDAAVINTDTGTQTLHDSGAARKAVHGERERIRPSGMAAQPSASLNSNSIVQISGSLDRADATIDADEVAILSDNGFYAAGQVTYVTPSSGPATQL